MIFLILKSIIVGVASALGGFLFRKFTKKEDGK